MHFTRKRVFSLAPVQLKDISSIFQKLIAGEIEIESNDFCKTIYLSIIFYFSLNADAAVT